jgi:hypothetical protein
MKRILGIFLAFTVTTSMFTGLELFSAVKPAVAMSNGGGNNSQSGPAAPDKGSAAVSVTIADAVPGDPLPSQDPENGGKAQGGNYTPPKKPPVPPRAYCQTYNGSTVYPVNSPATCAGTIIKSSGASFPFTCAPTRDSEGNPVSAIYVTYNETISYAVTAYEYTDFAPEFAWGIIGGVPENYWTNKTPPGGAIGQWKVLSAKGTAYTRISTILPYGGLTIETSPWYSSNSQFVNWKAQNKFNYKGTTKSVLQSYIPTYSITDVNCVYPFKPKVQPLYTVTCLLYYDSTFYQSLSKDAIRSGGSLVGTRNGLRAGQTADINQGRGNNYGVNASNHLNCNNDTLRTTETYDVDNPEDGGYGYYRLSAQVHATRCAVEGYPSWTQDKSKDRVTGCTDPFLYNTYNSYATYSCEGFIRTGQGSGAWAALPNNVNFAVSACEPFVCTITGTTRIGNSDLPIQVMRNGENIPVTYPTVSIDTAGSPFARPDNGAPNWESVTSAASGVTAGSSPFYGNSTNSSKQYFNLRNAEDRSTTFLSARSGDSVNANNSNPASAWQPLLINGAQNPNYSNGFIRFNWASDTGKTWNMFRTFRVAGEFYVPIVNGSGGGTSMGWQSEDKYCGNVVSNSVTVVRSVNEIQQ